MGIIGREKFKKKLKWYDGKEDILNNYWNKMYEKKTLKINKCNLLINN